MARPAAFRLLTARWIGADSSRVLGDFCPIIPLRCLASNISNTSDPAWRSPFGGVAAPCLRPWLGGNPARSTHGERRPHIRTKSMVPRGSDCPSFPHAHGGKTSRRTRLIHSRHNPHEEAPRSGMPSLSAFSPPTPKRRGGRALAAARLRFLRMFRTMSLQCVAIELCSSRPCNDSGPVSCDDGWISGLAHSLCRAGVCCRTRPPRLYRKSMVLN